MDIRQLFALLSLLALLGGAARAADIQVPGDFDTIQDAVDAAGSGDTVVVRKGVYRENPTVITNGIHLLGRGAEIDGQYRGPCLFVLADGVTIEGFTLINGGDAGGLGDTLSCAGEGARILRNTIVAGAGTGINVAGVDMELRGNRISDCAGAAIRCVSTSDVSQAVIRANRVERCGAGISAEGGSLDVRDNSLESLDGAGIEVAPDVNILTTSVEARIESNRLSQVAGVGIAVDSSSGGEVTVRANRVDAVTGVGVDVAAGGLTDVTIVQNRVRAPADDGLRVTVASGSFFVADNVVVMAGADGVDATAGVDGGKLETNTVRGAGAVGMRASGDGVILRRNRVSGTVAEGVLLTGDVGSVTQNRVRGAAASGVRVEGDDVTLADNHVTRCGDDGLRVSGSDNTIRDNTCSANGGDGIDLEELGAVADDTDNEVVGNVCVGNRHEGIDNSGLNTVIDGNRLVRNGGDFGPAIAGAGNDVDGDDLPDGTVASFQDNVLPPAKGGYDPGGPATAQRLDRGVPAPE